ncbi:dihydroorotate dehydrogenase [Egicoccus sp. AB-alg2]|uniref:dihydroorotate dehydrogenase n=1 Tax=Egicoccus sp. AB-alg2 TaxID=3242693 RepID=UPI00359D16E4
MSPDVRRIDPADLAVVDERAIPQADVDTAVDLAGIALDNPITTASGCFASGVEIDRFYDVTELGAVVVKSITLEPREGLPTPRMAETPSGMLNAIGLQNPGIDGWLDRDLPWLQGRGAKVIASIAGKTVEEYREVARRLRRQAGVVGIEVNLSCPNVEHRGLVFACSPDESASVIAAVARETDVPVFAKLTSDVTDIVAVARSVVDAGADGLTLINTLLGMAIDPETGRPRLHNTYGGLSGPAIKPVAVRNVHQVHQAMPEVPIIGCGGVRTVADVIEFTRAGATAVAVGTANFVDPFAGQTLVNDLRTWLAQRGIASIAELRGKVTT